MAQSLYFLIKGVVSRNIGTASLCLQLIAAAALAVAPVLVVQSCPRSQACSSAYQALTSTMMDDGTGGWVVSTAGALPGAPTRGASRQS